jgi:hypothetical protein
VTTSSEEQIPKLTSPTNTPSMNKQHINLKFRRTDNTDLNLEVDPDDHVQDVREQVASAVGADAVRIRLIFGGRVLQDGETIRSYGIHDGNTVHVIVRPEIPPTTDNSSHGPGQATSSSAVPASDPAEPQPRMTSRSVGNGVTVSAITVDGPGGLSLENLFNSIAGLPLDAPPIFSSGPTPTPMNRTGAPQLGPPARNMREVGRSPSSVGPQQRQFSELSETVFSAARDIEIQARPRAPSILSNIHEIDFSDSRLVMACLLDDMKNCFQMMSVPVANLSEIIVNSDYELVNRRSVDRIRSISERRRVISTLKLIAEASAQCATALECYSDLPAPPPILIADEPSAAHRPPMPTTNNSRGIRCN